ncbi:MAG: UDP-3-O-acyl-N-acetylglucosamine deacetylase [Gammaproteobacteria bacterium]|nr:UDP-3-O-acyl-N-acetylglucosamine deacetylase [Gammaproteobacteria bacterium]
MDIRQRTIHSSVETAGIGLHSGKLVKINLRPASLNTGIVFRRTDLATAVLIPLEAKAIQDTEYASSLVKDGVTIKTVEHLLSACAGLGIDNLFVDVEGEEIPILDGSAAPFVHLIRQAGIKVQDSAKKFLKILKPIEVRDEIHHKWVRVQPYNGCKFSFTIEFSHAVIAATQQFAEYDVFAGHFEREIARARTFGFIRDVEFFQARNLSLGASFDNVLVLDDFNILNPGDLRYPDEFVRHKILDAMGDMMALGCGFLGEYQAYKSGHKLNNGLVQKIQNSPDAVQVVSDLGATQILNPKWSYGYPFNK